MTAASWRMVSLAIALTGATALTVLTWLGWLTPNLLLALCFVVGSGMALFGPAWQSSVSEQVPPETLPAAVALNGISYNIARSFGPAIGGVVVAAARRGRGLCAQCAALSSAAGRAVPVESRQRAVAPAARKTQPRHGLRRALHHQFAADQDRADAHAS